MRPIVGPQLPDQVLDVEIDRTFRDRESIGDLLVLEPISNECEHLPFAGREVFFPEML